MSKLSQIFLHALEQKHLLADWNFPANEKSNPHFGEIYPGAGMIAFQKYRSNPYPIVRDGTVSNAEALSTARVETGTASATRCSTSNNVNRAKVQA